MHEEEHHGAHADMPNYGRVRFFTKIVTTISL
jgi:hypothetical protein